jgi:hypothetical protein
MFSGEANGTRSDADIKPDGTYSYHRPYRHLFRFIRRTTLKMQPPPQSSSPLGRFIHHSVASSGVNWTAQRRTLALVHHGAMGPWGHGSESSPGHACTYFSSTSSWTQWQVVFRSTHPCNEITIIRKDHRQCLLSRANCPVPFYASRWQDVLTTFSAISWEHGELLPHEDDATFSLRHFIFSEFPGIYTRFCNSKSEKCCFRTANTECG